MLIGISGATLSGKTTTSQKLSKILQNMGYTTTTIPEFAREIAEELGFKNVSEIRKDPQLYFKFELEILKRKIKTESKNAKDYDFVLCDTTTAEILLYTTLYLPPALTARIKPIAKANLYNYNLIFLLEPLNVPSNDNFRSKQDIAMRKIHHNLLKNIHGTFIEIPALPLDKRLKMITTIILNHYKQEL